MVKFLECFSEQLVPYVQYCIHALFPPNQVASHLGTTVSQLQKDVNIFLKFNFLIYLQFIYYTIIYFLGNHIFESAAYFRTN